MELQQVCGRLQAGVGNKIVCFGADVLESTLMASDGLLGSEPLQRHRRLPGRSAFDLRRRGVHVYLVRMVRCAVQCFRQGVMLFGLQNHDTLFWADL